MTAIARLGGISLDASDVAELAAFYRDLLELEVVWTTEDFIALKAGGIFLTVQRVADHQPPDWPSAGPPKQLHLELAVSDLEAAEASALALSARKPEQQPCPDEYRVLIDPAGHPFCLTTQIPDP
jgi:catechol 2,3-dioxygenase-like lactoylglutathione lyase family enzyme